VNFNLKPEEEMDFMPIIPLNETDAESNEKIHIPSELALLPLRNTVLFPGVVLPITVGRDKSIKAVTEAYKTNKLIGVVAQKDSAVEDPTAPDWKISEPWPRSSNRSRCLMAALPSSYRARAGFRLKRS
jgi:ATP-dependent Lon protease